VEKTNGDLKFTGVVVDQTERKQAEQALQQAQAELAHATRVTALSEMAASIAHEVNQPLGAIVNNSNFCLQHVHQPEMVKERRKALIDIVDQANRASQIIKRIRAFSEKSEIERNSVSLKEIATEVLLLMESELSEHGIRVETNKLSSRLKPIWADRIQVQQVLLNLMRNSLDAMKDKRSRTRRIILSAKNHRLDGRKIVILSVEDSGRGLNAAQLPHLFEAFYTTKLNGMGMGLRIVRSIVEAHGGHVWAKRNIDKPGATFYSAWPA
jgi:C4-dicarboxylate-specific signal transduction histidine kinase